MKASIIIFSPSGNTNRIEELLKVCLEQNKISAQCIHCFNCISECPQKVISPVGDLEKAKTFMENTMKKAREYPDTCLYPNM